MNPKYTYLVELDIFYNNSNLHFNILILLFIGEDNEYSGDEIWLPCSNGKLDRLAFSSTNWFHYRSTTITHKITAICTVDDHSIWLGDAKGQIHAYS